MPHYGDLRCSECREPVEQFYDSENETCERCYDAWFEREYAYWRPLYDGEKQAGLLETEDT